MSEAEWMEVEGGDVDVSEDVVEDVGEDVGVGEGVGETDNQYQRLSQQGDGDIPELYIREAISRQLTSESPQAPQPSCITVPLRPHQKTLLAAARLHEKNAVLKQITEGVPVLHTNVGVIADRVGAGKSLVVLSLVKDPPVNTSKLFYKGSGGNPCLIGLSSIKPVQPFKNEWASLPCEKLMSVLNINFDIKRHISDSDAYYTTASLLLIPHTVAIQWSNYIKEQTQGIKTVIIRKAADCVPTPKFFQEIFTSDLVVITNTMFEKLRRAFSSVNGVFSKIVWSRMFVDEADSISTSLTTREIHYRYLWLISGSWINMLYPRVYSDTIIRHILGESSKGVRNYKNFIGAELVNSSYRTNKQFAHLILRNSEAWLNQSLTVPIITHITIQCSVSKAIQVLRGVISSSAMEALHAGDIQSAMSVMNIEGVSRQEDVVSRVTAELRRELTEAQARLGFKKQMGYSSESAKKTISYDDKN